MEQLQPFMQQITQNIDGKLVQDMPNQFDIHITNPHSHDHIIISPIIQGKVDGIHVSVSREIDLRSSKYTGDFTKCEKKLTQHTANMEDCGMVVNSPNKHITAYCRQEKDIFAPYDELIPKSSLFATNISTIKDDINEMRMKASQNLKVLFDNIEEYN